MPREIVILSPTPPDARALVEAGAAVDPELGLRSLSGGAIHQVCRTADDGDHAVLSVHQPLQVDNLEEIARLLPAVAPRLTTPLWWVEALAPWGEPGRTGVAIAQELAVRLGGACIVQDGE
ncbi:hypothetical protein [Cellulomonas fimi]|uniref:Uncharacterized protein n=1 Tax=Cellulomonas fimi TaxID=1708 RepID=A0A7Y0M127_CELFI|nr:hypothetical protein [Cellulomonas fimi]NMR21609.1 hypothetical protein [Cellulomonas fimi]